MAMANFERETRSSLFEVVEIPVAAFKTEVDEVSSVVVSTVAVEGRLCVVASAVDT